MHVSNVYKKNSIPYYVMLVQINHKPTQIERKDNDQILYSFVSI